MKQILSQFENPMTRLMTRPTARPLLQLVATYALALAACVALPAMAQAAPGAWGHGHGENMMHLLTSVGATDTQIQQIQAIMKEAHASVKTQMQSGRSLHQQLDALLAQSSIDANAAEALRQQEMALHDASSKILLQARIAAANVLTPAQRAALGAKQSQFAALMKQQRAERAALTGASQ
jgi:Spy/CpxP family protein refolding chaperone